MAQATQEITNDPNTPATSEDAPAATAVDTENPTDKVEVAEVVASIGGKNSEADPSDVPVVQLGKSQTFKIVIIDGEDDAPEAPSTTDEKPLHPQQKMSNFWLNFTPDYEGMVTQVLPESLVKPIATPAKPGVQDVSNPKAGKSYDKAKADCIRTAQKIVKECQKLNMKYSDAHFDIEYDLKISRARDCLDGLVPQYEPYEPAKPGNVRRVTDMFTDPQFFKNGATSDDINQGMTGDCWFLSALSALCSNEELLSRICVYQSQTTGVYGFVFHRDGEWQQCIIDDKLYLRAPAYEESGDLIVESYNLSQKDPEGEYTRLFQTGSRALLFAQSADQNKTWVPLLEKAFAKAHGDYAAIEGGQTGEAIEDLTGGVTTEINTNNILSKENFWNNELSKVGKEFLFSCALAYYRNWRQDLSDESDQNYMSKLIQERRQSGIIGGHAYAVLDTYEGLGKRLVKVRNPWGRDEWTGPWSDGSKEWTEGDGDWTKRLNHKFGDDGIFWMNYSDFLKRYIYIDRTRVFGPEWHIAHEWTSVQVPWSTASYHDTKFSISVPAATDAVIVLAQLDERYYYGLQGKYEYKFHFRVQKDGDDPDDYLARSRLNYSLTRSVNVEVELEPGTYTVLMKIEATEWSRDDPETVIRNNINRREKVIQVGMSYDLAHRKGLVTPPPATETKTVANTTPAAEKAPADTPATDKSDTTTTTAPDTTPAAVPDPEDKQRNPWNAATIVGLKVYSKQADLNIKVILPEPPAASGTKPAEKTEDATLDGDDAAKPALDQAAAAEAGPGAGKGDAKAPAEAAIPAAELPIRVDVVGA